MSCHSLCRWREDGFDGAGCWWQSDGADAMEVSISGSGCRPTIAAAMWGEAAAAAAMANLTGNAAVEAEMLAEAAATKRLILGSHWSEQLQSFAVISPGGGGALHACMHVRDCNLGHQNNLIPLPRVLVSLLTGVLTILPSRGTRNAGGGDQEGSACNLSAARPPNRTVTVRELLGFMPFYYGPALIDRAALAKVSRHGRYGRCHLLALPLHSY
eukprot:SAG22_NODE_3045_length_1990_cov_1.758858_2_plen_214_part_00